MVKDPRRSECPIHCSLNLLGDRWTLVIVRDLLVSSRATFGELLDSPERIATNTLSKRLAGLEAWIEHQVPQVNEQGMCSIFLIPEIPRNNGMIF